MPHQCLNCGETFREGSVEILDGCPECEGTRFFHTDEALDEDEREDLRDETQQTVREAIKEALEDPDRDDDVWSWERREEWLRLDPEEAREVLHDAVEDADVVDADGSLPDPGDIRDRAPDDDGTALEFPDVDPTAPRDGDDGPDPGELTTPPGDRDRGGDRPRTPFDDEAPDRGPPGEAPEDPADELLASEERSPTPPSHDDASPDRDHRPPTPAELANRARPTADVTREEPDPGPRTSTADPSPRPDELPEETLEPEAETTSGEDGQVSTVNVEEPGRYELDVEGLLETSPVIVEKDGHYMVHLPSIFHSVDGESDD